MGLLTMRFATAASPLCPLRSNNAEGAKNTQRKRDDLLTNDQMTFLTK